MLVNTTLKKGRILDPINDKCQASLPGITLGVIIFITLLHTFRCPYFVGKSAT